MKEVKPMWNMCRILEEKTPEWVAQIAEGQAYDSHKETLEKVAGTPEFNKLLNQTSIIHSFLGEQQKGELKIFPTSLLITYIQKYIWMDFNRSINISTDKVHTKEIAKAKAILQRCINHNPSFIQRDGDYIFLTERGANFCSDWFGLFKQYIIEMGSIWVFVSGLILGLLPYIMPLIINLIQCHHLVCVIK